MGIERQVILRRLLEKYEHSMHLCRPGVSKKRVMLQIERKALPEYQFEIAAVRDAFNEAAGQLEKEQLVKLEWLAGRPVISLVVLNLETVEDAYRAIGQVHPKETVSKARAWVEEALSSLSTPWILAWGKEFCMQIHATMKLPKYCKNDLAFLQELLHVLFCFDALGGDSITMRAFSLRCFHDSKRFEKEFLDAFLAIARAHHPELLELSEHNVGLEMVAREELACVGIYARAELYELSGDCTVETSAGKLDIAATMPSGIALPSTIVDAIVGFDFRNIERIIWIENKTNYDEYVRKEHKPKELVIFHGGFLSPKKRVLVQKIMESSDPGMPVYFWADIDLGGFRMFSLLQRQVPMLLPMRMGREDVVKYASRGLARSEEYLSKLENSYEKREFPLFQEAIAEILRYGVTIEQEIFLANTAD